MKSVRRVHKKSRIERIKRNNLKMITNKFASDYGRSVKRNNKRSHRKAHNKTRKAEQSHLSLSLPKNVHIGDINYNDVDNYGL